MRALPSVAVVLLLAAPASAQSFSHADWSAVLAEHVDEQGLVSYRALAADRSRFDRYLAALRATSPDSEPARFPTDSEKLAYWINAYNASVFELVLARGPERRSVWGDGLLGIGFFTAEKTVLGGRRTSLKALEDDVVRGRFRDPRVHAALNCASLGCPRLARRAFEPATLDADLDAAMRTFVAEERNVQVDSETAPRSRRVNLSKIFDWFEDDFLDFERRQGAAEPKLIDFVNRFRAAEAQIPAGLEIRFFDYDKRLNGR